MEKDALRALLELVASQQLSAEQAATRLANFAFTDMDFAKVDHHRSLRTGYPEVIFCQGKRIEHVLSIIRAQIDSDETVFGTRASPEMLQAVQENFPQMTINATGRCFWQKSSRWQPKTDVQGPIVVISAGTSDAPVSEETRTTIELFGHPCTMIHDVGVAGIHRLFAHSAQMTAAAVIIAIAGMEGALPSVITGLVAAPVIAVPTSVGYGAHLGGMVPLFAMLNSCATGLTVVNIDNGFGAAVAAVRMNTVRAQQPTNAAVH